MRYFLILLLLSGCSTTASKHVHKTEKMKVGEKMYDQCEEDFDDGQMYSIECTPKDF